MPPKSKKRKLTASVSADEYQALLDTHVWPGWCEIESEPAYFNVMLRELGVQGLKIQEVLSLEQGMLEQLPKPVHALIFLFQYRGNASKQAETTCPEHVWFANQVPDFSCASVALLNIVNNIPGVDLGPQLRSFQDFTRTMTPMDRGYAIDSFQYLKSTHNSFARELDILNANMTLKNKHEKLTSRVKLEEHKRARVAKAAENRAQMTAEAISTDPVRRSTRKPQPRKDVHDPDDAENEDCEPGFHFIAYIPIRNHLWRLDGLDCYPMDLGAFENSESWMSLASTVIQDQMDEYSLGELSFSLMAVVHDSYPEAKDILIQASVHPHHEAPGQNGHTFTKPSEGVRADAEFHDQHDPDDDLHSPGHDARTNQTPSHQNVVHSRMVVAEEEQRRAADARKAMLRRTDFRAFFAKWADALHDADVLDTLREQVKAGL